MNGMPLNAGTALGVSDLGRPYEIKGNVTPEANSTNKYYSIVQNGILYKFGPGRFPSISIDTVATASPFVGAQCTIVGNLTDN